MPTSPIKTIVARDLDPSLGGLLLNWSKYLDEIVNFGSHVFKWIGDKDTGGGYEEAPLFLTFRNALELIDSISVLYSKSLIDPCKLHLRALLESFFVIRYITESDSKRRSMNYLVCHFHNKLDIYRKLDPNTQQGAQWCKEIKSDILAGDMEMPEIDKLQGWIDIENILSKQEYAESEEEYQRIRQGSRKKPVWYEFFDGPRTVLALARHLKLLALYNILYRSFSKAIHGQDIIDQKISKTLSGDVLISQIRDPRHAQFLCTITVTLACHIFKVLVEYYIPERREQFAKWYFQEIKQFLNKISKEKLLEVK